MELTLYGSQDCGLCDDALVLLQAHPLWPSFHVAKVDIYRDKSLLVQYKTRIPVLEHVPTRSKLYWPFDEQGLSVWIQTLQKI